MVRMFNRFLLAVCMLGAPTLASAQTSELYLSDWTSPTLFVVQNGQIVRQFTRRDTQDGPGLAVVDTIKMIGVEGGNVGRQYDLDGNLLSGAYTNPGFSSIYDGATDGQNNWSIAHNDSGSGYALVEGDADWGNLQVLFVPQTRSLGITYDANTDTFWVGADAPGGITHVQQYSRAGALLFDFDLVHSERSYGVAWDPADDTLWIPTFGDAAGRLFQYDKQGNLLGSVSVPGMENAGILGATFAFTGGGGSCNGAETIKKAKCVVKNGAVKKVVVVVKKTTQGQDYTITLDSGESVTKTAGRKIKHKFTDVSCLADNGVTVTAGGATCITASMACNGC